MGLMNKGAGGDKRRVPVRTSGTDVERGIRSIKDSAREKFLKSFFFFVLVRLRDLPQMWIDPGKVWWPSDGNECTYTRG